MYVYIQYFKFSVTLFTYAKISIFRGPNDTRIKFSPIWTLVNFVIASLQIFVMGRLLNDHLHHHPIEEGADLEHAKWLHIYIKEFFYAVIALHLCSALLTTIYIFYDSLFCWCCPCWLGASEVQCSSFRILSDA